MSETSAGRNLSPIEQYLSQTPEDPIITPIQEIMRQQAHWEIEQVSKAVTALQAEVKALKEANALRKEEIDGLLSKLQVALARIAALEELVANPD